MTIHTHQEVKKPLLAKKTNNKDDPAKYLPASSRYHGVEEGGNDQSILLSVFDSKGDEPCVYCWAVRSDVRRFVWHSQSRAFEGGNYRSPAFSIVYPQDEALCSPQDGCSFRHFPQQK
jgi:hypothetical protein